MIRIEDIGKRYGDKPVLEGVSVHVPEGRLTAFIGPNGAGKSTLLSILARTLQASGGSVYIDDKALAGWKPGELARRMSVLRQSNHTDVRLSVQELVSFGRFPYSAGRLTAEDRAIVDQSMAYMGILELKDRLITELSGGQRQMAYIAMVIAQDTDYILLDEPLNNLDMKHAAGIMKVLARLCREKGKTVCVVIHDINFVSCYADYIVGMREGRIVKKGCTDEVITEPVLRAVYDMDMRITQVDGHKICVYYT